MIITVDKVNKTYKNGSLELQVLKNISFKVDKGEFLAIMGSSGSGKSTMMNILGCLDNQYEGRYILDGIDISKSTENELSEIRNKKIGFIFQSFNLLPRLTALENVELPLVYSSIPKEERHKRANELLEMVGLKDRTHHRPKTEAEIIEILQKLNKMGKTIVIVTHEPSIGEIAQRKIVFKDGEII